MSRIDEALRIREAASGRPVSEVAPAQPARSLSQYAVENPGRRAHEEPASESAERDRTLRPDAVEARVAPRAALSGTDVDRQARLVTGTSNTVSLEQYRKLAAVLHEEQVQSQLKTVMITSALPNEGKTLTVVNLALTLSESYGRRVLVIDADLRSPSVHTILNIRNERGLSEALRATRHELPLTDVSGRLSVLTAGKPGATPLAALTSARMGGVIEECASQFDWVLIDTPPVGVLPDAQVLARFAGGVILVIGAGSTPAAAVDRAIAELGGPDAVDGIVLNRVEDGRIPESGYYSQYGLPEHDR